MQAILDRLPKKEVKKVRVPSNANTSSSNAEEEVSAEEEATNGNAKPSIAVNRRS